MKGSAGHVLEESGLLAEALDGLLVLLDGELHVADDAVIALLFLREDLFQVGEDLLEPLVALLGLHLLHCRLLQVDLVLLQVLERLQQNRLVVFHLQAALL